MNLSGLSGYGGRTDREQFQSDARPPTDDQTGIERILHAGGAIRGTILTLNRKPHVEKELFEV